MAVCERCHTESADTFRFCPECGAPLPERTVPRQTRKVVTALFCDVTGSTALGEELDPEVLRLAHTLLALGRREEAATEARAALDLYEGKGDRPSAADTRAMLAELGDAA